VEYKGLGWDVIFKRSRDTADTGNCVSKGIQAGLLVGEGAMNRVV